MRESHFAEPMPDPLDQTHLPLCGPFDAPSHHRHTHFSQSDALQGDFAANMKLLQHYPPTDVRTILARAREQDIASVC